MPKEDRWSERGRAGVLLWGWTPSHLTDNGEVFGTGHSIRSKSRLKFQHKLVKGRKKTGQMWKRVSFQIFMSRNTNNGLPQSVRKRPAFSRPESSWGIAWGMKEISPRLQLHSSQQIFTRPYSAQVKQSSALPRACAGSSKARISALGLPPTSFAVLVKSAQHSGSRRPQQTPDNTHKIISRINQVMWEIFLFYFLIFFEVI